MENRYCKHVADLLYASEQLCVHKAAAPGHVVAQVPLSYLDGSRVVMATPPDGFEYVLTSKRKSPDLMELLDEIKTRDVATQTTATPSTPAYFA